MESQDEFRPSSLREVALYCLVLAIVALFFWKILLRPSEILYSPVSDILAQHYPFRHLMVESLREKHRLPTWNPTAFAGMPLVGDPQAGLHYPPNWLHALSPADECAVWFGYLIIAHLVVGGWGVLWWLRPHGFTMLARLAAALAFMFCGKWILHVVVPGHIIFLPMMFLPWQLGLIDRVWSQPKLRHAVWLAILTAAAVTGSHSQQLFFSHLIVVLPYSLVSASQFLRRESWKRSVALFSLATLLGLVLAAVHLLPIFGILKEVVRGEGVSYEMAARRSQQWSDYITFLLPSRAEKGHWENVSHAGVAAIALAVFGLFWRQRTVIRLFFVAIVAFCLIYALGENGVLHRFLFDYFPGFSLFRIPSRMFLILGLPIAYLVACGVSRLSNRLPSVATRFVAVCLIVLGLLLFANEINKDSTYALTTLAIVGLVALVPSPQRRSAFVACTLVGVLLVDQARFLLPNIETKTLQQALGDNPLVTRLQAPLGKQRFVALNYAKPGMYTALPVAYATPHGLENIRGFNPLIPERTFRFVRTGVGREEYKPFYGTGIREFQIASRPHLDLLNVRWVITDQTLSVQGLELRDEYRDLNVFHFSDSSEFTRLPRTYLYENTRVLPRAFLVRKAVLAASGQEAIARIGDTELTQQVFVETPAATGTFDGDFVEVAEIDHRGDEIHLGIDAGAGGYLVLSEMWYPGWHAWVDGKTWRPLRVNGVFMGLKLPPGKHQVRLRYLPAEYRIGWWISVVGIAVSLALLLVPWHRLKKQ